MGRLNDTVARAVACLNTEDSAGAESACRDVLTLDPVNGNALRVLGAVARKRGELQKSLEYLQQAVRLYDRSAVLQFELGTVYTDLHRHQEAFECYRRTTELDAKFQEAYLNLGAVMEQQERFEEAIVYSRQAVALKPECGLSHYNLANAQRELGRIQDAIESYTQSLRFLPNRSKTWWNLGLAHLLLANYCEGWPLYESRQDAGEVNFDHYPQPRWDGSSLAGRTIVVHAEQGIGDEVLFASCLPDLIPQAGRCILVCEPRLQKLFARSFPQAVVHGHARRKDRTPAVLSESIDVQIPAGSLPLYLRREPTDFPRRKRFLMVDARLEAIWRERLVALGPELKVGISWRAGGKPVESRKRSLSLEQLLPMLSVPGVRFVNLQYGDASREIAELRTRHGIEIHDWEDGDPLVDLDSYAAKLSALDLVVSVGNATVHLAGAVGTPAWSLLPMVPSWRWMVAGQTSPWYSSVRLFRQPQHGAWQPVLDRVVGMLRELAAAAPDDSVSASAVDPTRSLLATTESSIGQRWLGAQDLLGHEVEETVKRLMVGAQYADAVGNLSQAEAMYREVLQLAPRYVEAWCGLGVVARKSGQVDSAIRSFRRALAVSDSVPAFHLHLADALVDAGRHEEALGSYRRAIELDPRLWAARRQVRLVLQRLGRHAEAVEELNRALLLNPQCDEILSALGHSLTQLCRIDDAIECFEGAAQQRPDSAAAHEALGVAYLNDQRRSDAEKCFRRALALDPLRSATQVNLGHVLEALGRKAEAIECFARALELEPASADIGYRLALLRREFGDLAAAADLLAKALAQRPGDARIQNVLGVVLRELGQPDRALEQFEAVLRREPNGAEAHFNRSLALLQSGQLAEGWSEYESRWQCAAAGPARDCFSQPRWDGSPLTGKTLLIHPEQSSSEEILFASCYGDVLEKAGSGLVLCDPRLQRLFERSFPKAHFAPVPRGRESQCKLPAGNRVDLQIAAGSLPLICRPTPKAFPQRDGYLTADGARTEAWSNRYAALGAGMKIGIAWRDPDADQVARRLEPDWSHLGTLLALPGIQWISLLDDADSRRDLAAAPNEIRTTIHHWPQPEASHDLDDLAARIAAVDMVIAVGGLSAHLAGALGLPAWVLTTPIDWRWLSAGDVTPWYSSVRLLRPDKTGWHDPIVRVREELLKRSELPADELKMGTVSGPHWHVAQTGNVADSRRSGQERQSPS